MTAFFKLLQTEIKLSLRDMNMVIFAVLMPLAVLVILGIIYGSQTIGDSSGFLILERSFGALCAISVCAGGLMGLPLLIADYREKKILKRFHVTPVRPVLLLAVELTVYVLYCSVSLVTLAIAAKCIWGVSLHGSAALFLGSWLLTTVSTLSIGLMVGGIAKNSKQAGVIACLLYFPMLIFSGTTLPLEVMPQVMQNIVRFFPLTQGIEFMKSAFLGTVTGGQWLPVIVMLAVTLICSVISVRCFRWE